VKGPFVAPDKGPAWRRAAASAALRQQVSSSRREEDAERPPEAPPAARKWRASGLVLASGRGANGGEGLPELHQRRLATAPSSWMRARGVGPVHGFTRPVLKVLRSHPDLCPPCSPEGRH